MSSHQSAEKLDVPVRLKTGLANIRTLRLSPNHVLGAKPVVAVITLLSRFFFQLPSPPLPGKRQRRNCQWGCSDCVKLPVFEANNEQLDQLQFRRDGDYYLALAS